VDSPKRKVNFQEVLNCYAGELKLPDILKLSDMIKWTSRFCIEKNMIIPNKHKISKILVRPISIHAFLYRRDDKSILPKMNYILYGYELPR
jgi:hypothetical protein